MKTPLSISAFFPAYNDAGTIATVVRDAIDTLSRLTDDYEVVVVNDGSADKTGDILDALRREQACLKVIHHEKNRGYGGALITGFANVTKDLIFYTDGDGQYDVHELSLLMAKLTDEVDIVNGYKISRSDPLYRIVMGRCYQVIMRFLFRLAIRDVDCDFRLFRAHVFNSLNLTSTSGVICIEMMKKLQAAGFKMVEVPVHHFPRSHGRSQFFSLKHLSHLLVQLFSLWWRLIVLGRTGYANPKSASKAQLQADIPDAKSKDM